jgi:dTDP-L-rhamnose 4-epimerase
MKIVITGGAGFIGNALARRLTSRLLDVTVVDCFHPQIHGAVPSVIAQEGVHYIRADIRNLEMAELALDQADVIYHLAAETGTGQSMYRVEGYVSVNEMGTAHLLQTLGRLRRKPRKIILASSRSVYGEGAYIRADGTTEQLQPRARSFASLEAGQWDFRDAEGTPLVPIATPETLPYYPGSVYASTKAAQELLLISGSDAVGARTTILRLQNVYGEGQSLQNPYTGILSIFFNRARQGLGINLYEDGGPSRDFVHVDDVVAAFEAVLDADLSHGTVMNVGSGHATTIKALAETLLKTAGLDVPITVTGQFRVGDVRHNWADTRVAASLIGYAPAVDLSSGLGRFVAWAMTQPAFVDLSARAELELREKGLSL